ncbi:SOUL family heme-binding protein [Qipengyuania aquimaris]|uniref:SOUL family heme-binding protein n=1 Tax=Qipengyuania aquimaris TaxID=255984 RepID=UPI001FD3C177|nr:heme-binding protein [Qipengyuania aquimaris]UOR14381.1 heme-binding protein [Qipengyuania aquimaris]
MSMKKWVAVGAGLATLGAAVAVAQYRDTETPAYSSIDSQGAFELREYEPMIVAEVTHTGERRRALNAGFRRLAAYIFAEDRPGDKIAMTSPVMQDPPEKIAMTSPVTVGEGDETGTWRTRFVMPAKYTMETLPEPPSDITLTEIPARRMASVQFDGRGTSQDLAKMEGFLRRWMDERGLEAGGPAEFAFYDAPMVPPMMRRNEVMIPVR